jgi:hypothetical protein
MFTTQHTPKISFISLFLYEVRGLGEANLGTQLIKQQINLFIMRDEKQWSVLCAKEGALQT